MGEFLATFAASFFAILAAGLIIAIYNHRFIKEQRRREVVDAMCSDMRRNLNEYFSNVGGDIERKALDMNINIYVGTFMLFLGGERFNSAADKKAREELRNEIFILLNLDNDELSSDERFRQSLMALSRIRYFLTI